MNETNNNANNFNNINETHNNSVNNINYMNYDGMNPLEQKPITVLDNDSKEVDGRYKCPNCGSAEILFDENTGKLKCVYCHTYFDGEKLNDMVTDLSQLKGEVIGSGATNIKDDATDIVTIRCNSCGAEIVIDSSTNSAARCHWCRSILSLTSRVENGATPDVILPFSIKKEEAKEKINEFVKKRQFFAHPQFKKEFTTENIMGVYFPYMLVDANAHCTFEGEGEHLVRRYTVKVGDHEKTKYDADLYQVGRDFDILIDDLTIESNSDRLNKNSNSKTNNIINSIMPFDTENCIKYRGNYLIGYTSEKRNINIKELEGKVDKQLKDVCRHSINQDLKFYDRGVRWDKEDMDIRGKQWIAAYLPVWLYSYREVKNGKELLHYVAVNARTKETMGSVPINTTRLLLVSGIIEVISSIIGISIIASSDSDGSGKIGFLFFLAGFVFYFIMYARYRNQKARHTYEKETKFKIDNIVRKDQYIKREHGLDSSRMKNANNTKLEGEDNKSIANKFIKK